MADKKRQTIFNKLNNVLFGSTHTSTNQYNVNVDRELYRGDNKEEYEIQKIQAQQQKLLSQQWKKSGTQMSQITSIVETNRLMMYKDANLMDYYPEIGAALDIYAEESTTINEKGKILNIYSSSDRIKSVLEDLFINKLDIHVNLPLWCRNMCKYGDTFLLLNIDSNDGVLNTRQLPVDEIERIETDYLTRFNNSQDSDVEDGVKFIWRSQSVQAPFNSWQIAHFRLLNDTMFLPYGVSILAKARRHWRLLTMMEDLILIYRLERSIERRVYKIYVGNIDDADVPAYVNDIANNFKRTQIIDPNTGQIDLRKNILGVDQDIFIPTRSESAPNPIDTLQSSNNLNTTEDLKFFQDKLVTALRIPKSFLNFEDSVGDGKNLAMLDIRFERNVNRIQQALLMELNKIALIHLYLLGFTDELNNFTLTLNNPSRQSEILRLDELQKRVSVFRDAVQDPGNGIPMLSWTKACRDILKLSDYEITQMLEEIRLEKAIASEFEKTSQIIKRTGIFDNVDRLYGELNAEYSEGEGEGGGPGDAFGGGGFGGGDLGGEIGGGELSDDDMGLGNEGDMETLDMGSPDMGGEAEVGNEAEISPDEASEAIGETSNKNKPLLNNISNKKIITEYEEKSIVEPNIILESFINKLNKIK